MPDWKTEIVRRLADPSLASRSAALEEIAQHLDDRYRSLLARGLTSDRAYAEALDELSDSAALAATLRANARRPMPDPPALDEPDLRGTLQTCRRQAERSGQGVRHHRAGSRTSRGGRPAKPARRRSGQRASSRRARANDRPAAATVDAFSGPRERRQLLDQLWEAEQRPSTQNAESRVALLIGGQRANVKALQQTLANDELVLEYVLSEPQSYCLVIGRGRIRIAKLASRAHIEALADRFTQELRNSKSPLPAASKELHDAILAPIQESQAARRLFVVPDGKLHLLAFDALLDRSGPESRLVSTVPSANVFVLLRTRLPATKPERALMGVGGVPYDRMFGSGKTQAAATRSDGTRGLLDASYPTQLAVLPKAEGEVLTAARVLGPTSAVLTGDQATESAVKTQALGDFDVFHFAVHAFADPKFPGRAALVLLNDPATGDDGLLQPREIGQFRLNAGVVVLSACDTAVGPTLGQEGVLNIARAFLLAGARSVITTLWAVSDATSTAVMRRFYENLAAGDDVASALARAKATVVGQFGADARATTAAFQIVGVGDHRVAPTPQKTAGPSFAR